MKFAVLLFWVPASYEIFTYAPLCGSKAEILNSDHGNHGEPDRLFLFRAISVFVTE